MSFVYFLLLVGVLVIIHEFGHFVAAKLLDVRVLRFSIGYGRPLFRIKGAETEYQLAVFPVGGYVRILGVDDAPDAEARDRGRSFANRPLWQRLVIIFAGPAANLILPILIYFVFFAGHTELPAAVVGDVFEDSPAARAGIASGDTVLAVDGKSVRYWEELERAIRAPRRRRGHPQAAARPAGVREVRRADRRRRAQARRPGLGPGTDRHHPRALRAAGRHHRSGVRRPGAPAWPPAI
jgi:RIP metalloprotease RseP